MNKYKDMEIKSISCEECLFNELLEAAGRLNEGQNLLFFARRELADFIIRSFIAIDEYSFGVIDFDNCEFNYCDEYMISIDENKTVWCEPVIKNDKVDICICKKSDIVYVYKCDIRQEIIDRLLDDNADVTLFGFEDEEEFNLNGCNDEDDSYISYLTYLTNRRMLEEELAKLRRRL